MSHYQDRAALVAAGFVECECGRTKRIPPGIDKVVLDLYISGVLAPFRMRTENPSDEDRHVCDPRWLRDKVIELRGIVDKRNQKLREMGVGMARLKIRAERPTATPGKYKVKRLAKIEASKRRSLKVAEADNAAAGGSEARAMEIWIEGHSESKSQARRLTAQQEQHRSFEEIVDDVGPVSVTTLAASAPEPPVPEPLIEVNCGCCLDDCDHDEDGCTCVEGCPHA